MAALDPFYSDKIIGFEGYVPQASWDYKQYTNGYGTRAQSPGETIDREEAQRRFDAEIGKAADSVDKFAPNLSPGQRAALTSLTYNAGPGWMNSGLGEAVKSGDWETAQQRFLQYNKAGGKVLPGLQTRRQEEASWFNQAPPLSGPINVASLPKPAQPISGPSPLSTGQPLQPQPLNLAAQQPSYFDPQQAAMQQMANAQPQSSQYPQLPMLNAPVRRAINLAQAFSRIPLPPGFRGLSIG